ncbi:MAG: deoxyribodipyrimidine photo-lyase [Candidatus Methanofastidiosa archaeon]|nr:deoxyribodipyrimidine photo-lyase [Candidatus Methanofastidiosa archaeon]
MQRLYIFIVIERERITLSNEERADMGDYVMYWMQSSQRVACNHALGYAIEASNEMGLPLLVFFNIANDYPNASYRHYLFMIEGLREIEGELEGKGIKLVILKGRPEHDIVKYTKEASLLVTDVGYTKTIKSWKESVITAAECPVASVESNIVVPVEVASSKEEYSAATIRPKIKANSMMYLNIPEMGDIQKESKGYDFDTIDVEDPEKVISELGIPKDENYIKVFAGGRSQCLMHLDEFLKRRIEFYGEFRNDPTRDCLSNMGPYLHFGQISPIEVAMRVIESRSGSVENYLDELIVRRELAINFTHFNNDYDDYSCLPEWAKETLGTHSKDTREYVYDYDDLKAAVTHDVYWNAAQREMALTGKMHGYMRMYWGKKILEWSESPKEAFQTAIRMNDEFEIDGRDPNGYAGVAWCFGKHDRPWKERGIFGKVRYMNANGLKRKFDVDKYVKKVENYQHN